MEEFVGFFGELWAMLSPIAVDALLPALLVSVIVGALKWRNLVSTSDQIRTAVAFLSLVSGGFLDASGIEDAVLIGLIGSFASIFHALAENYGQPLVDRLSGQSG